MNIHCIDTTAMDSFSPTASSFSSFAFAQAGAFLFQFNPETDGPIFADPDLLPELRNLRLAHSLIREALEKSPDEESPLLSDILEDLALYTNAVHRCSATARHLLLQNDPRFLKDARVISRQRQLLKQLREARTCSEKLQYRLDEDASLTNQLNVTNEDVQTWLGVSSPGLHFGTLDTLQDYLEAIALNKWLDGYGQLLWFTSTYNDSSRNIGLAVAENFTFFYAGAFVGYTPISQPSRQLELVELLCHLLGQVLESPQCFPSAVLKGWFLTHQENRPSQQDAYRIFLNELRRQPESFLIFDGLHASKGQMEAIQPMFEDILQTGCKLFIICPFPLPAQLNTEGAAQITGATIAEAIILREAIPETTQHGPITYDAFESLPERTILDNYLNPCFGCSGDNRLPPYAIGDAFQPFSDSFMDWPPHYTELEKTQWDAMLRKLTDDTKPVVRVSVKMLIWLVFALDRLSMNEIKTATSDDTNVSSPMEHIKRLKDFVNSLPGNHEVSLKDPAMRPFLQQKLRGGEGIHADGPHALIAERCLSYINSVCNLGKLPEDNDELEEWICRYPLLRYASTFWGQHARQVIPASDQHISLLATLLESRYAEEMCALMFSRSEEDTKRHKGAYKGMTGLHLASAFGLVNVVSRMIQSGKFSPCLRTDDGWTALHWAVERFHPDVVTFLLALPNTDSLLACKTGSEGCTALHFAVKNYSSSMVEAMLKAKVDVNAQDRLGRTSLHLAVWSGQEDVVEQLLSGGADPNIRSIYGTTLHCAVKRGTLDLIRTLISASGPRIDLNIKDILPLTALQEAQARGRDDVAAILLEAGAKSSPSLILTQAYFMGSHQGLSAKEGWQGYEVDSELSTQIKVGNQCTCHVLKSCKQELRQAEAQVELKLESKDDLAAPTRVFRKTFDLAYDPHGQVQKYLLSEWRILFKLRHPHIVRYIDSDEDPHRNEFLLYMEYCDGGDLESFHGVQLKDLATRENKRYGFVEDETTSKLRPLTGVEVWAMVWQMASALAYLHYGLVIRRKNGLYDAALEGPWAYIIHRDVKPANIVMHGAEKDKFLFKLCDLGIASHAGLGPDQNQTQLIGSSGLQPPEVRQGELWTTRGDMFSLGETIRLTAKLKDELLDCQPFKGFLDAARGIDEDSRPTSLEAMEVAYSNLRKAAGSFSILPQAVIEEMRAVHQVLGRWGGSYLFQSFLLTAELLDNPQPFQQGSFADERRNLVKQLWLLLDDGAEESFQGNYELTAHLLILLEGRSPEEKLSREKGLDRFLEKPANVNRQWIKSGWSAVHIAAQEGKLAAVKTLLRHGAKIDSKDSFGKTAKDYAEASGLQEIVGVLEGQGEETVVERREEMGGDRKRRRLI